MMSPKGLGMTENASWGMTQSGQGGGEGMAKKVKKKGGGIAQSGQDGGWHNDINAKALAKH